MTEYDATEQAWKNGAEYMREKILEKLLNAKGKALGLERSFLSDAIDMIRKLEVR